MLLVMWNLKTSELPFIQDALEVDNHWKTLSWVAQHIGVVIVMVRCIL